VGRPRLVPEDTEPLKYVPITFRHLLK
jgi:hypothetical protein